MVSKLVGWLVGFPIEDGFSERWCPTRVSLRNEGELVGSKNSPLSLGGPGPPMLGPPPFSWTEVENLKGFHQPIQGWKAHIGGK